MKTNLATQCQSKKALQRTTENGNRYQPPSAFEYEALASKSPLEVTVSLMNGESYTLPLDSSTCSREVILKLVQMLSLSDAAGFALYISLNDKVSSLGDTGDRIMDSIARCEQMWGDLCSDEILDQRRAPWKLFMRREILPAWPDDINDKVLLNLTFAQIQRGLLNGEYACNTEDELASLVAQLYYIEYGMDITEDDLRDAITAYLPSHERENSSSWLAKALAMHEKLFHSRGGRRLTKYQVKFNLVQHARKHWQKNFCRFYDIRLSQEGGQYSVYVLGINGAGISLFQGSTHLRQVNYVEIISCGVEKTEINGKLYYLLVVNLVKNITWRVESADAEDASQLVSSIFQGLRNRSKYALVTSSFEENEGLVVESGDVIELSVPAGEGALMSSSCQARKLRSEKWGTISTDSIYVLPTVELPPPKVLTALLNQLVPQIETGGNRQSRQDMMSKQQDLMSNKSSRQDMKSGSSSTEIADSASTSTTVKEI